MVGRRSFPFGFQVRTVSFREGSGYHFFLAILNIHHYDPSTNPRRHHLTVSHHPRLISYHEILSPGTTPQISQCLMQRVGFFLAISRVALHGLM